MTSPFASAAAPKPATGLFGSAQPSTGGGGGLFGNANANTAGQQQQQPGTFGAFTAQPAPQAPQQPQQQPAGGGGGLFGVAQSQAGAQPAGGGALTLFGQLQPQQQQQQQQPASGGGLFGAGQSQAGAQPPGGTSTLFGQPQPQHQQQPAGGGLFGAGQTQAGAQPAGGTSTLFGQPQPQQQQTGGGLFGAGQTQAGAQPAGGTSTLFGQPQPQQQQQQQQTGGGLFGAGQTQPGAQPAGGTSTLFGQPQPQQQQPQQQGSSLFGSLGQAQGNPPGFPSFGQPQPAAPAGGGTGLFGSAPPPNPLSTSAFPQSAPTASFFGPKPPLQISSSFLPGVQPSSSADNSAQAQSVALQRRIEAIVAAWNPASPQCRFQHYFYNLVDPRQISMYGRPQNAANDALWDQAVRENPDPTTLVPVLACGFDDLQKRVDAQSKQASLHQEKLKELQTRLAALAQTHVVSNTLRTTRALQTHTLITHRLMRILEHIHLLIPSLRSAAISPEEEALRARLERLRDDVHRGIGGAGGRGRINELWALLGAVQAARESTAGRDGGLEWKVVDKEGLERLSFVLSEQQQGLAHLMNIINRDAKDLHIIEGGERGGGGGVSPLGSSPLRGSGLSSSKDFLQSR